MKKRNKTNSLIQNRAKQALHGTVQFQSNWQVQTRQHWLQPEQHQTGSFSSLERNNKNEQVFKNDTSVTQIPMQRSLMSTISDTKIMHIPDSKSTIFTGKHFLLIQNPKM